MQKSNFNNRRSPNALLGQGHASKANVNVGKEIPQKRRQVFIGMMRDMISDTNYTQYDFYTALRSHKGRSFRVPTDLIIEGLPLLHACVLKARYSFLTVLFYLGWLPVLTRQKVRSNLVVRP